MLAIDWTFSAGNIITVIVTAGGALLYIGRREGKVTEKLDTIANNLESIDKTLKDHGEKAAEQDASKRVMETRVSTLEAELNRMRDQQAALVSATHLEAVRIIRTSKPRIGKDTTGATG